MNFVEKKLGELLHTNGKKNLKFKIGVKYV